MTKTQSILGERKLAALRALMHDARAVPGAVAECGVYRGGILAELVAAFPGRPVYGFDTFSGLPASAWLPGEVHTPGEFADAPTMAEIAEASPGVTLVPGIFPTSADGVQGPFAFVHVDFDFEASTAAAIAWFMPRMSSRGVMVFDDYRWAHCPGVERAIAAAGLEVKQSTEYQAFWIAP